MEIVPISGAGDMFGTGSSNVRSIRARNAGIKLRGVNDVGTVAFRPRDLKRVVRLIGPLAGGLVR